MSKLTDLCMAGATLTFASGVGSYLVDVAIPGSTSVVFALGDWWRIPAWHLGTGIEVLTGHLAESDVGFVVQRTDDEFVYLGPSDDSVQQALLDNYRQATDIDRDQYLDALDRLREQLENPADLDEWIAAVKARPTVDPVALELASSTRTRMIGRAVLKDVEDHKIAALAIDEDGRVAVSGNNPWLASIADMYSAQRPRPVLSEWMDWLGALQPQGLVRLSGVGTHEQGGTVEQVADGLLASFP